MSLRQGLLFFCLAYSAIVGITLLAAPLPQMILPWEAFVLYDGGWRVLHGLVPHADFYSPLEPLSYLIAALGMVMTGDSPACLSWGNALASIPLAAASWFLLSRRLAPLVCLLACLYLVGLWLLPFPLRFGFRDLTWGGLYNRQGYALLGLLIFLVLFRPLESRNHSRGDLVAAGLLLGFMAALKIDLPVIGALFVGLALLAQGNRLHSLAWIGLGVSLVVLPLAAYLRFDLAAVLRDYTTMSLARGPGTIGACVNVIYRDLPAPAFFNLVALVAELKMRPLAGFAKPGLLFSRALEFVVFEGAQVLGLLSNAPEGGGADIPLLDLYGLIQAQRLAPLLLAGKLPSGWRPLTLLALAGAGYPFIRSLAFFSMGYGFCVLTLIPSIRDSYFIPLEVRTGVPSTMLPIGKTGYNPTFAAAFGDGKALLERHVDVHRARIGSFDEANPFPFAFRGNPAPGMPTFWQDGRSVGPHGYPPADEIFRDCDCLLVPKWGVVPATTFVLLQVYADTLQRDYTRVETTPYWDLYVRKSPVP